MSAFIKLLQDVRKGELLADLDEHLQKLVQGIREHGSSGSVSLNIKLKAMSEGTVALVGEVSSKVPKETNPFSIFFTTEDFTLSRNNPDQPELYLRSIDGGKDSNYANDTDAGDAAAK